jgi:hypothetical protein
MARRVTLASCLALLALAAWLLVGSSGQAAASEAAVVVRHGDGSMTYALVTFPEEQITSFELLDRSTLSLTTVAFGGLGDAVCTLDGEGCPVGDCRQRLCQTGDPESPFWQFFRRDDGGNWITQPLGASAARVSDGEIDVWSWTGGSANVPPLDLASIARMLGVSLDDSGTDGVVLASFDALGNRTERGRGGSDGSNGLQILVGVVALVLLAGVAVMLAARRRAEIDGTGV